MDRDNRWERIKLAFDLLTQGKGEESNEFLVTIKQRYQEGQTDEFLQPIRSASLGNEANIKDGDHVFFFNFRTDRPRQLTMALTQQSFPEYNMKPLDLEFLTMTRYDEDFKGISILFEKENLQNTIGELISKYHKSQLRIAETEKYPHVTFFFSGGREKTFPGEERIVINSPKVATYDLQPEMSAYKVSEAVNDKMKTDAPDFICLNYANADMVGHTGDFDAAIKAVEAVDKCLKSNVELALEKDYEILIISDHGNSDLLVNEDGSPNTAHTKNPVPIIHVSKDKDKEISNGILADVAPTLLALMGIEKAEEMSGKNLIS
jgi:2,3-bisphosphoglycerate-independent phosphoglycerate mutase